MLLRGVSTHVKEQNWFAVLIDFVIVVIGVLISALEGNETPDDDAAIKLGLDAASSTGRLPPRSATYVQLTASGELKALSNDKLRAELVEYDARLQRDAFIHTELVRLAIAEISTNTYVDFDLIRFNRATAAIDELEEGQPQQSVVRSYQLDGVRKFENRYETIYRLHVLLLTAEEDQLLRVDQILRSISRIILK